MMKLHFGVQSNEGILLNSLELHSGAKHWHNFISLKLYEGMMQMYNTILEEK
jgi:hypothetical protein